MIVLAAELTFHIPDAHSLKDKRQACRSLVDSVKRKFNAAIAEVDTQDAHQLLTLGVAVVSGERHQASKMLESILRYLEDNPYGQLMDVERLELG